MTREEVIEIMNYCKEHKVTYKSRLEELNIPVWRFYDSKSRVYRASPQRIFVSNRMANVSVTYHTLLSTGRKDELSTLEYLKKFCHKIAKGRKDCANLFLITIGISVNKY